MTPTDSHQSTLVDSASCQTFGCGWSRLGEDASVKAMAHSAERGHETRVLHTVETRFTPRKDNE